MPKQSADAFIMSDNMWGKPLPATARKVAETKKKKKVTRMQTEDDIDSDVDDELEEGKDTEVDLADENDDELVSDEALATVETDEPDDEDEEESDEDDDDLDPEDVVDSAQDEVEATVAEDEEDGASTKDANNRKVVMSEKKSGADHIRDEINKRKTAGDSMRGVDIVAALAKRKIEVSPAQVSQLLKKAGMSGAPRTKASVGDAKSRVAAKGKAKTEAAPATPRMLPKGRAVTGTTTTLPMSQLRAAAAFLSACDGCYTTAEEILSTHKQLGAVYDVSR
ncbi:hypothetical protein [Sphingorhabdus sp.]|uniref:hypothetical protein n=1 Tax=Sphingorhabdus sp. TaxID=1902408 RepID=UPI003342B5CA